ncbi:hypothetical protein ACU8KH_02615 [Lachancea thermotolerans]
MPSHKYLLESFQGIVGLQFGICRFLLSDIALCTTSLFNVVYCGIKT